MRQIATIPAPPLPKGVNGLDYPNSWNLPPTPKPASGKTPAKGTPTTPGSGVTAPIYGTTPADAAPVTSGSGAAPPVKKPSVSMGLGPAVNPSHTPK